MADTIINDGVLKSSVSGTEKIPVSGSGKPVINADLIAEYYGQWVDYVPTVTGFSTPPSFTVAKYCKIGKLCFVTVFMEGAPVSNATTFTITLPFAAGASSADVFANPVDNGGSGAAGLVVITAASNVASLFKSAGAAWTASGQKRGRFSIFYITE